MARIFISHSSHNNDRAIQLRDWLVANGWDDIFLDLDPERGIAAGERWKEALQKAAQHCEVVLALISPEWLASDWCRPELNTAQLLGKKIILLLIGSKPSEIPSDLKDAQYVDLINDPDAYTRLKEGLKRAGLDPASFPFEEGRRPYPGFAPLEEEDAAIFFGRDGQIVRGLDKLRGLARAGVERMLIILGASGSGKSSFLRAGLWPRLQRDNRTWLPLPTIRPERAAISGKFGLVETLHRIMNEALFAEKLQKQDLPDSRADIEEFVTTRDDGLLKILAALREAGDVLGLAGEETPPPTIVIPIDQGEELFNQEGQAEAKRFIDILTKTLEADSRVLALLTMRTDSFAQFQNDPVLAALPKDTFTLDRMLEGSYRAVIEGPAALVKPKPLKIDPQLTDALLQDVAGQDALALLAFTLRYLYDKYQANNELGLEGYEKLGRLKGVIETTVKQALADGVTKGELPKDEKAQLALIRMAFIPHLARVNAAGQFVRRVATRAEIPPEARPLIDRFAEARLLIKDRRAVGEEDVEVVEVAHEALLREWKDLNTALLEEREFLIAKGQLEQDVAEWQASPEERKKGALLAGNKLARTRHWLIQRPQDLTADERRFIQASADAEAARRRWLRMAAALAFIVIAAFAAFAGLEWRNAEERRRVAIANESRALVALSRRAELEMKPVEAVKLALASWPREPNSDRPFLESTLTAISATLAKQRLYMMSVKHNGGGGAALSSDASRILSWSEDGTVRLWDAQSGQQIGPSMKHEKPVGGAAFSRDESRILSWSDDDTVRLWDARSGQQIGPSMKHESTVFGAAFSRDESRILSWSSDETVRLWDAGGGQQIGPSMKHESLVRGAAFSSDESRILSWSSDGTVRLWDARRAQQIGPSMKHESLVRGAAFSNDESRILSWSSDGTVRLWDARRAQQIGPSMKHESTVFGGAAFSRDESRILSWSSDETVRLWDAGSGQQIGPSMKHESLVRGAAFSRDASRILSWSGDGTVRLWDAQSGQQIGPTMKHENWVNGATFSRDESRILSWSDDDTVRLWDAGSGQQIGPSMKHESLVLGAAFSRDESRILSWSADGTIRLWDVQRGQQIGPSMRHEDQVRGAAFSRDERRILSWSEGDTVRLWDVQRGQQIGPSMRHEKGVGGAAFSGDASRILSWSEDGTVRLWDAQSGQQIGPSMKHEKPVGGAAFSRDERRILSWSDDDTVRLWDARSGQQIGPSMKHESTVFGAAFSRDESRILSWSSDETVRLWDAGSGQQIGPSMKHESLVRGAAFSNDESRILSWSSDGTVRLWDARSGQQIGPSMKHESTVFGAAFSNDESRILSWSSDGTVRLWESQGGQEIGASMKHEKPVGGAAFSRDESRILSWSSDGTVRLWDATYPKGHLLDVACALLTEHTLTEALRLYGMQTNESSIEPICAVNKSIPMPSWDKIERD